MERCLHIQFIEFRALRHTVSEIWNAKIWLFVVMRCQHICMRLLSVLNVDTYPGDECFSKLIDVFRMPLTDFLAGGVSCKFDAISSAVAREFYASTRLLCFLQSLQLPIFQLTIEHEQKFGSK